MKSHIVKFYTENAPDNQGRTIYDYWEFNHEQMEKIHDYIQWMFPTDQKSNFNPDAPVLTQEDIDILKNSNIAIKNLETSVVQFHLFLFEQLGENDLPFFWQNPNNHNVLRITRMLRCINLFGQKEKLSFYIDSIFSQYVLYDIKEKDIVLKYWNDALK